MHVLKTFLAGAFLGAGAFGALTHAAWTSTVHMSSIIPALSVADVIEAGGATLTGLIALLVVAKQDGQNSASSH
jgi:hypothetical protein